MPAAEGGEGHDTTEVDPSTMPACGFRSITDKSAGHALSAAESALGYRNCKLVMRTLVAWQNQVVAEDYKQILGLQPPC